MYNEALLIDRIITNLVPAEAKAKLRGAGRMAAKAKRIAPIDPYVFWQNIGLSNLEARPQGCCDAVAETLEEKLRMFNPEMIIAFERRFWEVFVAAYRWDVWAVAAIVNGGCCEDGFAYFRGWLIAMGPEAYRDVLSDPEHIGRLVKRGHVAECEAILSSASDAYEAKMGVPMPGHERRRHPRQPVGEPWRKQDLKNLYPKLYAKFNRSK